jgi:ribosomal protein S18 acetylase RimI-like enzyme
MDVNILKAEAGDLDEVLALQKLAYRSEAEIYNDYSIPPLHQTIDEVREEYKDLLFLKVVDDDKVIGSVRAYEENDTCYIGKLIVEPSFQNSGIGTKLMLEIERRFEGVKRFELFTGYKSKKNLHLYDKLGYRAFRREIISDRLTLIFMEKFTHP